MTPLRTNPRAVLVVVAFAAFTDYFIYGALLPLAEHSPARPVDERGLALLVGAYAVGVLVVTPLFGYWGDRIGLKRAMIAGVAFQAIALALQWLGPTMALQLLGRFCEGAAAAAMWTAGLALIASAYTENRVASMGYVFLGGTGGSLLGPIVGGSLYAAGGYALPFVVAALLLGVDATLRFGFLPPDPPGSGARPNLRVLVGSRELLLAALAVALAAFGWGIVEPIIPAQLTHRFGVEPWAIGLIFTLSVLAYGLTSPLVAALSQRVPIRLVVVGGTLAMAAGIGALAVLDGVAPVGIGICLISVAYAFMLNPTSAELANAVDNLGLSGYAPAYAVYNITYSLGMIATTAFASAAAPKLGSIVTLLCVSGALILVSPLLLFKRSSAGSVGPQHPVG